MIVLTSALLDATPGSLLISPKALSLDITPFELSYLLAHTSNQGVLKHSKIWTP